MQQRCPTLFWYFCRQKRWVIWRKLGTSLIPRPATQPLEPLERVLCIMRPGSASQTILMHPQRGEQEEPPVWGWKKGFTLGVTNGSLLTMRPCSASQTISMHPASGGEKDHPPQGRRAVMTWHEFEFQNWFWNRICHTLDFDIWVSKPKNVILIQKCDCHVPSCLVDCPTQLICTWIFICWVGGGYSIQGGAKCFGPYFTQEWAFWPFFCRIYMSTDWRKVRCQKRLIEVENMQQKNTFF